MTAEKIGRGMAAAVLALGGAIVDALLAALIAFAFGGAASLGWYVIVEGAPPLGPVLAAWRDDTPIALGLFLPPALTILSAALLGVLRLVAACWAALLGGPTLVWVPRLQRLVAERLA